MRVNKAKRKLMKGERYTKKTNTSPNHSLYNMYHRGHIKSFWNEMQARIWAPRGVRQPWILK